MTVAFSGFAPEFSRSSILQTRMSSPTTPRHATLPLPSFSTFTRFLARVSLLPSIQKPLLLAKMLAPYRHTQQDLYPLFRLLLPQEDKAYGLKEHRLSGIIADIAGITGKTKDKMMDWKDPQHVRR